MPRLPSRFIHLVAALLAVIMVVPGCSPPPGAVSPIAETALPSAAPSTRPPIEAELREAFRVADPFARREAVLEATEDFLRDPVLGQSADPIASSYFTSVAFSSGQLTLADPALIQRQGTLVVVALPEGMGIFLYDLSTAPGTTPLALSRWTVGLNAMRAVWGVGELGLAYETLGKDGFTRAHFVLARADGTEWQVTWFSDETPDWWFNARNGTLEVAPDLSHLVLIGEAAETTQAFYEQEGEPRRVFEVRWERGGNIFQPMPPLESYPTRQAWLWEIARPSPYATLVEFVERLQIGDMEGVRMLVDSQAVVQSALDFGLNLPERRFQVVEAGQDRVVFRDLQGTFVADFWPPAPGGSPWIIKILAPLGAAPPAPEPVGEP